MIEILKYSKFEIETDEKITLISPSGQNIVLTPFVFQPIEFEYDAEGAETVIPCGKTKNIARFFPDEVGVYTSPDSHITFRCIPSCDHGYVGISKRDKRYFAFSDGTYYNPIGINLAFITPFGKSDGKEFGRSGFKYLGMRQFESWFRECSKNGVNLARIWLGHEYLTPDTEQAGVFDPVQFSKIDALFELAEKYNIKLKLTLEQFRMFDYQRVADSDSYSDDVFRKFNKRLYIGEKRCESTSEWLSEDIWREKFVEKLTELSKRYAGNTTLFGVELWNEMNCLPPWNGVIKWNRYMLPKTKELFPNHLVLNSIGSYDCDLSAKFYDEFCWEHSDIKQMHRYLDQGSDYTIGHKSSLDLVCDGISRLADPEKPFLVAETGAVNNHHSGPFRYYSSDHRGMIFCDSVYPPVFVGAAGCGHIWHWDSRYVESKNLYKHFKPLAMLTSDIEFDAEGFKHERYEDDDVVLLLLVGKTVTIGYLRNKSDNWTNILRDLQDETPVQNKTIALTPSLSASNLKVINIMEDNQNDISFEDGTLNILHMNYGALLRFE